MRPETGRPFLEAVGCVAPTAFTGEERPFLVLKMRPDIIDGKRTYVLNSTRRFPKDTVLSCLVDSVGVDGEPVLKIAVEHFAVHRKAPRPITTRKSVRAISTPIGGQPKK